MPLERSLLTLIDQYNRKNQDAPIVIGSEITQPILARIPSGSLSLDVALGGGWVTNQWQEVIGHESAGKTYLVLKTIATNQRRDPKWTVAWFASETFVEGYAEMLGCDLSRIMVITENSMEKVFDFAYKLLEKRAVDCLVIDSLPALVPTREDAGSMEDFQPGLAANLIGKFFRKTSGVLNGSLIEDVRPITGFVINQWREKIGGYGDPRITPGGKAKNFYYFIRVDVQRNEWILNTKRSRIGQTMRIVNIKNKTSPPGRVAHVDAYFKDGRGHRAGQYDVAKDIVSAAIAYDVLDRQGSWYSYDGDRWQGQPGLEKALRTDRALRLKLRRAVLATTVTAPQSPVRKATRGRATKSVKKARA